MDLAVYAAAIRTAGADVPYAVHLFPIVRLTGPSYVGWWLCGLKRALRADVPTSCTSRRSRGA